jgi:hypothetical protein
VLPTHRLSPKHQVTIPRDCRVLAGGGAVEHLRGLPQWLSQRDGGEAFPYVLLLTEPELQRREQAILAEPGLSGEARMRLITRLNGSAVAMALDGQHRVVLAPHLVQHLRLTDRDVFFVAANTFLQVWDPGVYRRWAGLDAGPAPDPDLARFLAI